MKKAIILAVIVIIVGIAAVSKFVAPVAKPPSPEAKSGSNLPMYYSCEFGYGVGLPQDWVVNDRDFAANQEILVMDKTGNAIVKINASIDKEVNSVEAVQAALAKIKQQMSSDPNLKLASFRDSVEDEVGGYLATGEQLIDQENYVFQSQGLIHTNGRFLQFHGVIKADAKANYPENTISEIVSSFVINKELACQKSAQ